MLQLAVTFLVIALIAAFLGFGGVASLSFAGAKILFVVFLILAVLFFPGTRLQEGEFLEMTTAVRRPKWERNNEPIPCATVLRKAAARSGLTA